MILTPLLPLLASAAPATAARDPFTGVWTATDFDGGSLTLVIGSSGVTRAIVEYDTSCGSCSPGGYPVLEWGSGVADGSALHASVTGRELARVPWWEGRTNRP